MSLHGLSHIDLFATSTISATLNKTLKADVYFSVYMYSIFIGWNSLPLYFYCFQCYGALKTQLNSWLFQECLLFFP